MGVVLLGCSEGAIVSETPETASTEASPLIEALGLGGGAAATDERFRSIELEISACMRAEGFEYTLIDPSALLGVARAQGYVDSGSRGWVERYGLGVSTMEFEQRRLGEGLVGVVETVSDETIDPNVAYFATLTGAEQGAYQEVLVGCQEQASGGVQRILDSLGAEIEGIEERVLADVRVVELDQQLPDCLVDAGLTPTTQEDTRIKVGNDLADLKLEFADDIANDDDPFPSEMNRHLLMMQAEEVGVALGLYDCGGSHFSPLRVTVRNEYELAFLEEYGERIAFLQAES